VAESFADRLLARVRALGHPLCVGLDPQLGRLPPLFRKEAAPPGAQESALAVEAFCRAILDRVAGRVAAVKPQLAFFEALGWRGQRVLARVVEAARERDLLVILDGKRGDVAGTAVAYADAYLAPGAPLAADALTVNPYLGLDALGPFLDAARAAGAGVFVLLRTSNPGAGDVQDLRGADGRPVFEHLASVLAPLAAAWRGETGGSGLGVVAGSSPTVPFWCPATAPRERAPGMRWPASCPGPPAVWRAAW
jgi:orotidine-5'-phosphate decarboxylase